MKRLLVFALSTPAAAGGLATLTLASQAPQRSATSQREQAPTPVLRPPAVPLVAHDPHFSILIARRSTNRRRDVNWTGRAHPMTSLMRIDGDAARLMGATPANIRASANVGDGPADSRSAFFCHSITTNHLAVCAAASLFGKVNGSRSGVTRTPVVNLSGYLPPVGKVNSTKYAVKPSVGGTTRMRYSPSFSAVTGALL